MANISIEEFNLVVAIPFESPIIIVHDEHIDETEREFIARRDKETDYKKKVELDRARALFKWASCCSAKLTRTFYDEHKLKVSLGFSTLDNMIQFQENLSLNVEGATMK